MIALHNQAGWPTVPLGKLIVSLDSGVSVNSEDYSAVNGEPAVLKTSAVTYGIFRPHENKVIVQEEVERARLSPKADSILISRMNTVALVGASVYVEDSHPTLFLPDRVWQAELKEGVDARWLSLVLATDEARARIGAAASGTSGSMKNISQRSLLALRIPLPPYESQLRFAATSGLWDTGLAQLDALIAEKERQRDGLMQGLLTGEQRFPEFEGQPWQSHEIGSIASYYSGLSGKTKRDFGRGMPYVPYTNIFANRRVDGEQFDLVDIEPGEKQNAVQRGDILVTVTSETPEEIGMTSVVLDEFGELYLNSFCFGLRLHSEDHLSPEFAQHLFRSHHVRREIIKLGQGATRYNLSKKAFMKLEIEVPSVAEQSQITSVLDHAETEIDALRRQRLAWAEEKTALMQRLLTGKVRVPATYTPPSP